MKTDLPMRHQFVIANRAAGSHSLYLARSNDGYKWIPFQPLKYVMTFDERADAVRFSEGIPRSDDVAPEVICAWMPSVDEILEALDVPEDFRHDVATLRAAIGNLWCKGVLEVDRVMIQVAAIKTSERQVNDLNSMLQNALDAKDFEKQRALDAERLVDTLKAFVEAYGHIDHASNCVCGPCQAYDRAKCLLEHGAKCVERGRTPEREELM